MDLVELLLPSPRAVLYLGNAAAAVLLSSTAALLANSACRRRSGPFRYGLLLLGLVLVLTVPGTVWLTGRAGIGGLAQQGVINANEVKREFESNGFFEGGKAKIARALEDVTVLAFKSTPLAEVLNFFRDHHAVYIEFDERGLAAAGVRPDVPITVDENHLTLASALDKLLGPLGLTYVVDDEVILITAAKRDAPEANQGAS